MHLYEGKAPGSEDWNYTEVEFNNPGTTTKMLRNVVDPTLEVFTPEKSIATGTAVIICPGGGNVWLSYRITSYNVCYTKLLRKSSEPGWGS